VGNAEGLARTQVGGKAALAAARGHSGYVTRPRHAQTNLREEDAPFRRSLAAACSGALGDVADGIVLHGSLALGDHTPGHSDVDLLVIGARPLADGEITAVTDAIAADAREAPARVDFRS
jgi:nucleotidyltransferase-like protein